MKKTTLWLMTALLIVGTCTAKKKEKQPIPEQCCPCPPPPVEPPAAISGTWVITEMIGDVTSQAELYADQRGNSILHRSLSIQQPVPSDFATGNYTTIDTGVWFRSITDPNVFTLKSTSIVNLTTGIPDNVAGNPPFARSLTLLTVTISEDREEISYVGTTTLYDANDLNFNTPLQSTTGEILTNAVSGTGKRFKLLGLEIGP